MRQLKVSIQPLLLFYKWFIPNTTFFNPVSIQPLLLFYLSQSLEIIKKVKFQYNPCYCSIKWFKGFYNCPVPFQYNPCYCSIYATTERHNLLWSFNTTLVTVLWSFSMRKTEQLLVSIQPLLLFYIDHASKILFRKLFQYNPCYCSMTFLFVRKSPNKMFQYNPCYCSINFR